MTTRRSMKSSAGGNRYVDAGVLLFGLQYRMNAITKLRRYSVRRTNRILQAKRGFQSKDTAHKSLGVGSALNREIARKNDKGFRRMAA